MKLTPALILQAREELARRNLGRGIPVLEGLLQPARYKGAWGGRGSGKSNTFAELAVLRMLQNPDCFVVCVREVQKSLALSAKKLIEAKIAAFQLGHLFDIQQTVIKRIGGKGMCVFLGMADHTSESVKSLEGADIAWCEEAQSLSERSLTLLRPTIRKEGSEIWFSWNPRRRIDAVERLLRPRTGERADAIVLKVNYTDNPHLPETLRKEAEDARQLEPDVFGHVWLGQYEDVGSKIVIPAIWVEAAVGLAQRLGLTVTGKRIAALDVAGAEEGGDENGFLVRYGIEITHVEKWNGLDTSMTTHKAVRLATEHECGELQYDSVGVGEGVTGEWAAMGRRGEQPKGFKVVAWNGGMAVLEPETRIDPGNPKSPRNKDHYHNLKAQAGFRLRRRFQNAYAASQGKPYDADEIISISPDIPRVLLAQFCDELSQPQQKLSGTGKVMIDKAPDGAKSPNLGDPANIAFTPVNSSSGICYAAWG